MVVKGINHKKGEFQGKAYDNYQLFGVENETWLMVKVPKRVIDESGIKDITLLLNKNIEILYNRFGNVEKIRLA